MTMHTNRRMREMCHDLADNCLHLTDELTAIGIAKCQVDRTATLRGLKCLDRVFWVVTIAIEKVLRVIDHFATIISQEAYRVFDHLKILFGSRADDLRDMQQPSLTKNSDYWCIRIK